MEIGFEEGAAGVICLDESTCQTTGTLGISTENELDTEGFEPISWPAWRSEVNHRKHLYGHLGGLVYTDVYSYYFVGSETVLVLDIADSEAIIKVTKT